MREYVQSSIISRPDDSDGQLKSPSAGVASSSSAAAAWLRGGSAIVLRGFASLMHTGVLIL